MAPPNHLAKPRARLDSLRDGHAPTIRESRGQLDSGEIRTDILLTELAAKAEAERAARAESDELRRQLRELDSAARLPRVQVSISDPPKRSDWLKLFYKIGGAVTLFLGGLGTYLGARAVGQEHAVDKVAAAASAQKVIVAPLPEKVQQNERATDGCKVWARATDDYYRQVFGKLGVRIPEQPNAMPITPIETRAPKHRPNAITSAPLLEVLTPPPALP